MTSDNRMSWNLFFDIIDVLERHGYRRNDNYHVEQVIRVVSDLTCIYEGTREATHGTYPGLVSPSPHPEPGRPAPQAGQDAVLLADGDVSTVLAALDIAADYKRDRAEMCADCVDQSCPACEPRLQEAQAYDHLTAQILQAAEAHAARRDQPEPGSRSFSPGQADPAAGMEAGQ